MNFAIIRCGLTGLALLLLVASPGHAGAGPVNISTGAALRPGVYGRIEIGKAPPPPLIYSTPMVASHAVPPLGAKPIYLYVPPGQVRKWASHCAKYQACDLPVFFVRMDDSPSKLGRWKNRGDSSGLAGLRLALGEP
jgi:hypothetical protein